MTHRPTRIAIACTLCVSAATAQLENREPALIEAEQTVQQIFGPNIRRAAATPQKTDDLALAAQLLTASEAETSGAAVEVVLLRHAAALASTDPAGDATAARVWERLIERDPAGANEYAVQRLPILQRLYQRARDETKDEAGTAYLVALLTAAQAKGDAAEWEQAVVYTRQALGLTARVAPSRRGEIQQLLNHLRDRQRLQNRADQLRQKVLTAKDNDPDAMPALAKPLIELLLIEMDDPREAAKYSVLADDDTLKTHLSLARRSVESLEQDEARRVGAWYRDLARTAPDRAKAAMLERSRTAYERFLELQGGEGLDGTAAKLQLKGIETQLEKLAASGSPAPRRRVSKVDWEKDRLRVRYRWLEMTMSKGSWDYSDPDHTLLTDGIFRQTFSDHSVGWRKPAAPSPVAFDFGRVVRPKGVRVYLLGTEARGGGVAPPQFVRVYRGTKTKPTRPLANVEPVPDGTGWLNIPLPQNAHTDSRFFWIHIGPSTQSWLIVEEIEFR